jgi:phage terminase Nu1 subunit (DNA packaging protein)
MITTRELMGILNVSHVTLIRWRRAGMPHVRLGRVIRYDLDAVKLWMDEEHKNQADKK